MIVYKIALQHILYDIMLNPNEWHSDRLNQPVSLHKLSHKELIRELIFERLEYLAFETELSESYGFKKRVFPEKG